MGPGGKALAPSRDFLDPPMFRPDLDVQEWRKSIGKWVDLLKAAHDTGEDGRLKTIFRILGQTLYQRGLPPEQQSIVDEAQAKGVIDFHQTDNPVQAVLGIVNVVAVDPPMATVTRLIGSFNKVSSLKRSKNEDLSMFVSRFRGAAAEHLQQTSSSPSSQIGQVMAITLLNNANLDENVLTNAKLQLIALAEERAKQEQEDVTKLVRKKKFEKLVKTGKALEDIKNMNARRPGRSKLIAGSKNLMFDLISELQETLSELEVTTSANLASRSVAHLFSLPTSAYKIHLDDAVTVLRNITQFSSTQKGPSDGPSKELSAMMAQFKSLLQSHNNNKSSTAGNSTNPHARQNRRQNTKPFRSQRSEHYVTTQQRNRGEKRKPDDDSDVCLDCGKRGHWRGDPKCENPSYATKKKRMVKSQTPTQSRPDFHKGSRSDFGNRA